MTSSPVGAAGPADPADGLDPSAGRVAAIVHRHWLGLRPGPGLLPGRQHFDPLRLAEAAPDALPHLWLLDVLRDTWRFRYRLVGSALVSAGALAKPGDELADFDPTGETTAWMRGVCEARTPGFRRGRPKLHHSRHIAELEALALPLARDGRTVDMLLCCTVYHWQRGFGPGPRSPVPDPRPPRWHADCCACGGAQRDREIGRW